MVKYVGIRDEKIVTVSDVPFESKGMKVVESMSDDPVSMVKSTKKESKPLDQLKVAFVGNWKMVCGISTYSEKLWPFVSKGVGHSRLFVEKNDNPTSSLTKLGERTLDPEDVIACWKRGEPLTELVEEIRKYDADIVWVQHEFGIFPNARHWLSFVSALSDRRIIVTMHSVFHHRDKTICEAAIPEVVVHLDGAKKILSHEKKISGKVHVIPHGCDPCLDKTRLWNLYKSPRTFMQFGFGFRYKGWETSLEVTRILARRHSDVFFTGLFSESPFSATEHQLYYNELMKFVKDNNLESNVSIIRGFQSDEVLDSYMRTNQAVLFPYISHPKHEVFGASGAARMGMSKAVPVVTTSVNHFSDIPTIKGDSAEELAEALERLFSDPSHKKKQIERQLKYVEENSWENIAEAYLKLFSQ